MRSSTTGIGVFQTSNRRRKCAGRGPPRPDANRVLTTSIAGIEVGRIGLGCFALSGGYGPADDSTAVETIHAALELGVNLLDTSDAYAAGENERLVGRPVEGKREPPVITTQSGVVLDSTRQPLPPLSSP